MLLTYGRLVAAVDEGLRVVGTLRGAGVQRVEVDGLVDVGAAGIDVHRLVGVGQEAIVLHHIAAARVAARLRFTQLAAEAQGLEEAVVEVVLQVQLALALGSVRGFRAVLQLGLNVGRGVVGAVASRERELRQAIVVKLHHQARRVLRQHDVVGFGLVVRLRVAQQALDAPVVVLELETGGTCTWT